VSRGPKPLAAISASPAEAGSGLRTWASAHGKTVTGGFQTQRDRGRNTILDTAASPLLTALLLLACCAPQLPTPDPSTAAPARPGPATPYPQELFVPDDVESPLVASLYSLPSQFFGAEEARVFLRAVRAAAPGRTVLVLADRAQATALGTDLALHGVHWLASDGHALSPWTRDPLTLARATDGSVVAVARPNAQRGREADQALAPLLVETLPFALRYQWRPYWTIAPLPYHNGQVLLTAEAAWLSLHALETRALELLQLDAVPVETFGSAPGIARYWQAVANAADEAGRNLYHRPVRFVHPLPEQPAVAERVALFYKLGGGAGYDLDSLFTLLPGVSPDRPTALVADISAGSALLEVTTAAELTWLAGLYGLVDQPASAGSLGPALAAAQRQPRAQGLDGYLDLVAEHLTSQGLVVSRLPLLLVPTALLVDHVGVTHADFLLTWNNVVVERRAGRTRAEGFASGLAAGDRLALDAFAAAGCELTLLPTLSRSVVGNGGYRCASNHLRFAPGGG
jgi:hypothetical protein